MSLGNAKTQRMENKLPKTVGSTRLRRVQFGVTPNCHGVRSTVGRRTINGSLRRQSVSGATPETTRETRVLPYFNLGSWLPDMDLNHDKQIQSLLCYRYTIGQAGAFSKLNSFVGQSSRAFRNSSLVTRRLSL